MTEGQAFDTIVRITFIDNEYPVLSWGIIPIATPDGLRSFDQDDEHYIFLKPDNRLLVIPKLNVRFVEFKQYNPEIHKNLQNDWG